VKVWILIFYMGGTTSGGPAVIDNIATREECQRIEKVMGEVRGMTASRCIEVWKAMPAKEPK
jgi:hypothetical protein